MKYAKPSRSNPALIICAIDCSGSMKGSKAQKHAFAAINSLRKHARSKQKIVRLIVLGFSGGVRTEYDGWCEDYPGEIKSLGGSDQTHLKMACGEVVNLYNDHVETNCKDNNPLTNVLFFTDGAHTPGLDNRYSDSGQKLGPDKWAEKTSDQWIMPVAKKDNVLLGVIDYSGELPEFPEPEEKIWHRKVTCATVLDESILRPAYARDLSVPPPPGQSLREVLGPMEKLEGRRFIVSKKTIEANPQITSAFVRLGTSSTFAGADTDNSYPQLTLDDTVFKSKVKSNWGEEE